MMACFQVDTMLIDGYYDGCDEQVIQESLRISSMASGPCRKAVDDIEYGGKSTHKDWIGVSSSAVYLNCFHFCFLYYLILVTY